MTTSIHSYSSYVATGKKLQVLYRNADGTEQVLNSNLPVHGVVTLFVTDTTELVFREVPDEHEHKASE